MPRSAFAQYEPQMYRFNYAGTLVVDSLAGGIPSNPKIVEGWIKTKLASTDDLLRDQVSETLIERNESEDPDAVDKAVAEVAARNVNGFYRDENGLYIKGAHLKAALKEAACIARSAGKIRDRGWGKSNAGIKSWMAEHVFVLEHRLHLGVTEPTGIATRFIAKNGPKGPTSAIQNEEYVENATINFTIGTDHEFSDEEWAAIWLTGEMNGLGSARSQGYGRYVVTDWNPIDAAQRAAA